MFKGKKILAIIPARSGSKGLPRKNIMPLSGKPLIAWTIEAALKAKRLDRILVSTDDEYIAGIARRYGAEAPFLRPKRLATDNARGIDVILHAANWASKHGTDYDLIMVLQPTSPARTSGDIDSAIGPLFKKNVTAVVSVCEMEHSHCCCGTLFLGGRMSGFEALERAPANRQELPVLYRINGAIYLARLDFLIKQKCFFGKNTFAYIMPQARSIDIDTEIDFKLAEVLLGMNKE